MPGQFYKLRSFLILFLTLSIILANLFLPHPKAQAISIEKEIELGNKFLVSIKTQFEFLNDEFCQDYINQLGRALEQEIEVKPFPFRYYILKQNDLNAFAGPGGHIFLYSGLISAMEDVDELAGVLAHEMGHITARHLSRRLEQGKKISAATMAAILAGIFIGGDPGAAITTGSVAAGIQTQLHYSREDEREADQLGFKYASLAGFDPSGLIRALTVIQKNSWMESNKIPPYMRTHPTSPERIANLESLLRSFKACPSHNAETLRRKFPVFKTLVQAKTSDPDKMEQIFKRDLKEGRNVSLAHLGLGIVYKIKSEYSESAKHLKAALASMPSSVVIWRELGEVYQLTGHYQQAVPLFEGILAQRPDDRKATLLLAECYENLGQYDKAISLLKRLSFADKVAPEVYYHLGICHGRLKKLAFAHFYLGLYFKELGSLKKARFHFREARRLSEGNLSLQHKIERASKGILPAPGS